MNKSLITLGTWLTRRLTPAFLLLATLLLANQALAAPTITSPVSGSTLPPVAVGQLMSITITSTGGALPLNVWAQCNVDDPDYDGVTPCLPTGLILDPSPGSATTTLHGEPTTAGTYTFSISLNDGLNQAGVATYTLVVGGASPPTLTNVSPNTGTTAGATAVTLTGSNLTGVTAVSFGGTAATGVTFNSPTSVTATTPAHAAGAVNVVITTPGGTATLTNGYTYTVAAPTAGAVSTSVSANSSANPISLSLGGGAATSVAVSSAASHGTATASGTSISYTPTAGYSGADSFAYTATNASGTSSPATVTLTVNAPFLPISPSTLPSGSVGTAYSATLSASNGTAPYTYAVTAGSLAPGLSLNTTTGTISGTPSASGTSNFTITATDANSATGARAYTLVIGVQAPTAGAASATVAANSSATPITLNLGGGAATSVAVASGASHGTATASGTSISYTPTAGYSGADSFTYTATNASGTSSPATVTLTVSAPLLSISPTTLPNGNAGAAYSVSLSTSNGTAPYTYAVTGGSLAPGLSLNPTTGLISGTPSAGGSFNVTITTTDANSVTGARAYTLVIGAQAPTAGAVSTSVAANSSANPIPLNLGGGAATSVAVASAASHGTATASGTSISYTPTAGYSGTDSFTYTATNTSGTSSPATVTLTVSVPTLILSPNALSNGTVGSAYSSSLSTSGGTAPYSYAVTAGSLPNGMTLNPAGSLSGTPVTSGSFNFTITSTDANSANGSRAYTLVIGAQAPTAGAASATVPANSGANPMPLNLGGGTATSVAVSTAASHGTATASGTTISYTPTAGYSGADSFAYTATNASGTSSPATVTLTVSAPTLAVAPATLGAGTAGSAYSATVSASGGTAPYSYSISAGSLPTGMTLNATTGAISGTPSTSVNATFTVMVTDANSATGTRAYSISISAQPITVPASSQILTSGQTATVDLTQGATGGPFSQAILGTVTPASAGRATMVGPFSMRFVPTAAFAGTAIVTFSLQNSGGASAASSVSFIVQTRPDPTKDAEVIGLLNAQSRAAERFASTQMDNFNRRMEQLHQVSCDRNSFNASLRNQGGDVSLGDITKAVQNELNGTSNMSEKERRAAAADKAENGCQQQALAFWSDGFVNSGSTHARGARDNSFTTLGLSAGVDYRLSPSAIAGVGIGYGNDRSDIGNNKTRSDADAIGIATYLSLNLAPQVFVDGLLGYNRISFDSRRYITGSNDDYARGSRDADQLFASLTGSYEYRQGPLSLTPYGRLNASVTRMDSFQEKGGGIYGLSYDEQRQQNFTSFLGVRSGYDLVTRVGVVTPKVGLAWGHNFSNSSDYKMRYTDQGDEGILYRLKPDSLDTDFANLDLGVDVNLGRAWQLGFSYKTALGSDERSDMFRLGFSGKF